MISFLYHNLKIFDTIMSIVCSRIELETSWTFLTSYGMSLQTGSESYEEGVVCEGTGKTARTMSFPPTTDPPNG